MWIPVNLLCLDLDKGTWEVVGLTPVGRTQKCFLWVIRLENISSFISLYPSWHSTYIFSPNALTLLCLAVSRTCVTLEPNYMTSLINESPIARLGRTSNQYLEGHSPCFVSFLELLREKVALEKSITFHNGKLKQFNSKWKPVLFL